MRVPTGAGAIGWPRAPVWDCGSMEKRRGWDSNPRTGGTCQRFSRPSLRSQNAKSYKDLRPEGKPFAHHLPTDTCNTNADLAAVVAAWPELPEAIRAGILAIVKAASSDEPVMA